MKRTFQQEEVFPLIAQVIVHSAKGIPKYLTHDQIVSELLVDSEARPLIDAAKVTGKWETDRQVASNMVAWFSQQITIGSSPWVAFFDRENSSGTWSYRPKTAVPSPIADDLELTAIEGEPRLFFHIRRERSASLRNAKINAQRSAGKTLACEACSVESANLYQGLVDDIIEVHHRFPLSATESAVETTLKDLALLCPNCHRAIHRTKPMLSVDEFRKQILMC